MFDKQAAYDLKCDDMRYFSKKQDRFCAQRGGFADPDED